MIILDIVAISVFCIGFVFLVFYFRKQIYSVVKKIRNFFVKIWKEITYKPESVKIQ